MRRAHARLRRPARRGSKAKDSHRANARQAGRERPARARAEADNALGRIEIVDSVDAFGPATSWSKRSSRTWTRSEALLQPGSIVSGDASSRPTLLALGDRDGGGLQAAGRVAGYHFFNPVPVMKIVEVVDGVLTERGSPTRSPRSRALRPHAGALQGHAGLRRQPRRARIRARGAARPFRGRRRFRHHRPHPRRRRRIPARTVRPHGPRRPRRLARGDEVDVPAILRGAEVPAVLPAEPRVAAGLLGRKTGRGWYDYDKDRTPRGPGDAHPESHKAASVWAVPELKELLVELGAKPDEADARGAVLRRPAGRRRDHERARARPRSAAHRGGRSAVRVHQAPHLDEHSRHKKRNRGGARASPPTACRYR